ncbi:MAG: DUF4364 family protein [Acetobacter sp.]|nr:DUF4364 family protein [Bacteroides sp.]MCM1342085.1 DUF4364 family protein [Acetobacter sp.]MCM1434306.1 DUF4364 family protein [Clostridiales bacterium]
MNEKEYNPALEFDAFTAGIEDGGLRSSSTIAIIVCYILANCTEKITSKTIVDALVEGKIANYFEVADAIAKMVKNGKFIEDEEGYLTIVPDCRFSVEIVENDLPITIREKSIALVRKLAKREINKKENKVTIEQEENGCRVTLHVSDVNSDFMTLSLFVPTLTQAELIKERFIQNPSGIYENLMNSLF